MTSNNPAPYSSSGGRTGTAGRPTGGRRFGRGRKACTFCVEKINTVDYKSVNRLRKYMSDRARIESGKKTGTCARHQRMVRAAIKRARLMALLPLAPNHLRVTGPVSIGRGVAQVQSAEDIVDELESEAIDESEDVEEDVEQAGEEE